jgi:hypothetical protein
MSARMSGQRVPIRGDQAHPARPRNDLDVVAFPILMLLILFLLSMAATGWPS